MNSCRYTYAKKSRGYKGGPSCYGSFPTVAAARRDADSRGNPVGYDIYAIVPPSTDYEQPIEELL